MNFLVHFSQLKQTEVEKCEDHRSLDHHNDRNTQHKFEVLGLVTDKKHRQKHSNAAAQRRKNEKPLFGRAQTDAVQFGYLFVVEANDYRNNRNYRNVYDKYR